jgi:hypothetical protein
MPGLLAFGVNRGILVYVVAVRLSFDGREIKLVFSIPPHRPTPDIAPSWNAALTDSLPAVR